ncbi:penicillin-binding protein activator [Shewanella sp. Scap07]|uniref:penicillin-binding protein activator n=1 Tax=Shewanella sp. Scap07 TaxID=2589987 RepID=UPI0015BF5E60|nr:penicillin-binding protein activator [Shewanella sp. Scap07]QLE83921.1 penicillin-binding protein activator [Shewanella sp. Scap07]
MLKRLNSTKFISVALFSLVLFGCATTKAPEKQEVKDISLVSAPLPASQYLADAAQQSDAQRRDKLMLLAAHAFINQGDSGNARKTLTSIKPTLGNDPTLQAEHLYLSARVLEMTSTYDEAIALLNYPSQWQLPDWQWVAYYQFRAHLYQLTHQPIEQVRQLSLLSQHLPPQQVTEVSDEIWQILQPMQEETVLAFSQDSDNPIFAGWLQLAYIAKHYAVDPNQLITHLGNWQRQNPQHPGAIKLPTDLENALNAEPYTPKNIAVLLPLSGKRAALADTVKQGIISRYLADADDSVTLNFFDSALGATTAYQQAVDAGAEFIIGPLLQSEVEELQQLHSTPTTGDVETAPATVPQLFLNHVDNFEPNKDQFYFALSPAHEAADAAQKLYDDGITTPLLLASNNSIGKRMAQAFDEAWLALTDKPAEIHYYDAGDEMKVTVQKSLGVIDSKERIARIKALIGNKVEADFRSRRDIDAIYMIASSQDLPLLKPFIDVNFSVFTDPVPLYTTSRSRIESNRAQSVQELNNLAISDIPWLLKDSNETALVSELWPRWTNSQKRLYIMGYDALELVNKLAQMRALPGYQYAGRSGILSVTLDGTVNRKLSWGRYQRGRLRAM